MRIFFSLECKDLYTILIFHFTESSFTRWRQILWRRIRAACSSELLYRSLSDPKRLLMSRRSESDKLLRRVSQRARTFFRKMPEGLCAPSPLSSVLIFHGFQLCQALMKLPNGCAAKRADGCVEAPGICLLSSIYEVCATV